MDDDDINQYIFPYDFVPDTPTSAADAASYVGVEVDIPRTINRTIKDAYVYIYISVHKSLMNTEFRRGVKTDLIAYEIDKIMNGNRGFGIGQCELMSIERFTPQQDFYGRILIYKIKEYNGR